MIRFEDLVEKVRGINPDADIELLRRAYVFSAFEHKGQVRHSGEPYLVHPLEVADQLADMKLDVCVGVDSAYFFYQVLEPDHLLRCLKITAASRGGGAEAGLTPCFCVNYTDPVRAPEENPVRVFNHSRRFKEA